MRQTAYISLLLILLTSVALCDQTAPDTQPAKPLWLVVTRPMFRDTLAPLLEHRRQHFDVRLATDRIADAIKACPRPPDYILLVGDDQSGKEEERWHLPARQFEQHRWHRGQAATFAGDSIYGDRDGDELPDIPVGRIPARTTDQLKTAIQKIIAWDTRQPTAADLRTAFWACDPAFGALSRMFATPMALGQIETRSPAWLEPWVLAGDALSPFCGRPAEQPAVFADAMTRSGLSIIMAHASPQAVYVMQDGEDFIHFTPQDVADAPSDAPGPPLLAIACHSANFTMAEHCFGESLLFMPNGPVAVIGATAESHPLPNFYTGQTLLDALNDRPQRLGDLWIPAIRRASRKRSWLYEALLRQFEADRGMDTDPRKLQRDHPLLYVLLGDPATRLALPQPLDARLTGEPGQWHWAVPREARPAGVEMLLVQFRPAQSPRTAEKPAQTPAGRRKALQAANQAYAFQTLDTLSVEADWSGTLNEPGTLRLVALSPQGLVVKTFTLQASTDAP
jgi:hypothetical protein